MTDSHEIRPISTRGFTLVELLIVVAIIGILATIGVPTYQKMVQKSKKAEAKVLLGGLYTVETVFFSEFGGYGSQLIQMGVEESKWDPFGPLGGKYYNYGFPLGGVQAGPLWMFLCVNDGGAIQPGLGSPAGKAILARVPSYFDVPFNRGFRALTTQVLLGINHGCLGGWVEPSGASFIATASGVIAPGVPLDSNDSTDYDQWSMDNNRNLVNIVDGVK